MWARVGPDVGLQVPEQVVARRHGTQRGRVDGPGQDRQRALQLAGVTAERGEQGVSGVRRGAVVVARHRSLRLGPARSAQSAAEACGSQRWTSRCSPSAPSSSTSVAGSRVWPNRESRPGRSSPVPPAASAASVCSWRTSGGGSPTRDTSRRHSSACHARSSGSGSRPSVSSPRRHARTMSSALAGVRRVQPGQPAGDGVAPARAQLALLPGHAVTEVSGQRRAPRLVERVVDHLEQRPGQPVGVPGVLQIACRAASDQGPRAEEPDPRAHAVTAGRRRRPVGGTAAG